MESNGFFPFSFSFFVWFLKREKAKEPNKRESPTHEYPSPRREVMRKLGLEPDPWQIEVLEAGHPRLLLNCCRQAGKSTVVALLGLVEAALRARHQGAARLAQPPPVHASCSASSPTSTAASARPCSSAATPRSCTWPTCSRIVCLPCREETIRGYSHVSLLVIDEAARVPDDLYRAVRPMLAVSNGRLICLSTPYGKRGFFYDAWANGGADWAPHRGAGRAASPASRRSSWPQERRALGESWFRQEYGCSFEALEGLVYPDFARCVVPGPAPAGGRRVGGIDFGFRNPFAAVWGTLDRDGVLWLTGEHYAARSR